jgi:hypothetical protein
MGYDITSLISRLRAAAPLIGESTQDKLLCDDIRTAANILEDRHPNDYNGGFDEGFRAGKKSMEEYPRI